MRSKAILTSALVAMASLAACSGSTSNSTGGDGGSEGGSGVSAQQASTDAATAFCTRAQACAPAYITIGYGDAPTCATRLAKSILPAIGATGSTATPDIYEACATAIQQASCADLLGRHLPDVCKKAGTLADGTACGNDSQCANMRCKVAVNAVCGTCTSHAAVGASCGVDDDCVDGSKCISGTCAAFGKQGDTCSASQPCSPDLACRSGACGAPGQIGDTCASLGDCDVAHGVACDPTTKKCAQLNFAQTGGACGLVSGKLVVCQGPNGTCNGSTPQNPQGTCAAAANDGAACDTNNGPLCAAPAACVSGKCTLPDPSTCH
jgi:hypothetical protein